MEETSGEVTPQFETPAPKKINKRFLYLVAFIILIVLAFLGYKLLGSQKNISQSNKNITPTPTVFEILTDTPTPQITPQNTATPTPKPTSNPVDKASGLDRSTLSVTVENGSGEAGVAGKGSDYLKSLGYNVTSTGNADNYNYTGVTVQVKSASSGYLTLLKQDLGTNYTITSATSDLSDSNSSDALVIIGK